MGPVDWREIFMEQSVDKCRWINFCNLCAICNIKKFRGLTTCYVWFQYMDANTPNLALKQENDSEEPMDVDDNSASVQQAQTEAAFLLFNKFTQEVVVRLKQYKDDLLAACLTFLLSLPREIVIAQIHHLIPPLKVSKQRSRSLPSFHSPFIIAQIHCLVAPLKVCTQRSRSLSSCHSPFSNSSCFPYLHNWWCVKRKWSSDITLLRCVGEKVSDSSLKICFFFRLVSDNCLYVQMCLQNNTNCAMFSGQINWYFFSGASRNLFNS